MQNGSEPYMPGQSQKMNFNRMKSQPREVFFFQISKKLEKWHRNLDFFPLIAEKTPKFKNIQVFKNNSVM
jgi:hypothetical protein